jgi:hypothetical protein
MMAQVNQLPRPLLIAIAGAAVAAVLMVATRSGGSPSSTGSSTPATQAQTTGSPSGTGSQATGSTTGSGDKGGATATSQPKPKTDPRTLPVAVDRAMDAKKVIVLLLWNPNGSDDQSVRHSLTQVSSHGGKVVKFSDTLGNLSRYTRVTGIQSVTQTPAVVVVDRKGNGQVATGFLDTATVDQLVVDALR